MTEVSAIEAMSRAAGDAAETYGQLGALRAQRLSDGLLVAMQSAALTALAENITPEMRAAALKELSGPTDFDPKVAAWDAVRAFRAMLAEAMKGKG